MEDVPLNVNGADSAADRSATRFQVNPVRHSQQQQYQPQQQRNGPDQHQPAVINGQQLNNSNGGGRGGGVGQLDEGMTIEMYRTAPLADGDVEANEQDTFPEDGRASVIPPRLSR